MFGAVIAGGVARRLGTDKAMVVLGGQPLWQRQLAVLREAGADSVVLIRRSDQTIPPGVDHVFDAAANAGPLAGLQAAFTCNQAEEVAVLAVDMPGITASWFVRLRSFCRPGVGAMFRHAEAVEPLAAIYPRAAEVEIAAHLQRRDLSLQRLAAALVAGGSMQWVEADADEIANARGINTPDDLHFWRKKLDSPRIAVTPKGARWPQSKIEFRRVELEGAVTNRNQCL